MSLDSGGACTRDFLAESFEDDVGLSGALDIAVVEFDSGALLGDDDSADSPIKGDRVEMDSTIVGDRAFDGDVAKIVGVAEREGDIVTVGVGNGDGVGNLLREVGNIAKSGAGELRVGIESIGTNHLFSDRFFILRAASKKDSGDDERREQKFFHDKKIFKVKIKTVK